MIKINIDSTNIDNWIQQCNEQREAYYKDGTNTWGDDKYDEIHDLVTAWLEDNRPNDSFLSQVGADYEDDSEWEVEDHEYPLGSLNKCKEYEEFEEWKTKQKTRQFIIQEKLDGISIALTYDNGLLVKALTRKTGTKGEDIVRNVRKMKGIPISIDFKGHLVLRGEILLYHTDFEHVNKFRASIGDTEYKNPRNAAAGMAKDQKGTYCKYLTVQIYDIMNMEQMNISDELEAIANISNWGFKPVNNISLNDDLHAKNVYDLYVNSTRSLLNWDIDGMVIKTRTWEESKGKDWRKPKNKIAWKFPPQRAQTTIKNIFASPASRITPVAVFDPVECGGVTIQRASLANWPLALEKGIGPGAIVEISRRNDVIPYVESVLKPGTKPQVPKECPVCGSDTEWELTTSGEKSVYLICSNINCTTKLKKLIHKWLDIHEAKGVGSAFVKLITEKSFVTSLIDLLNLPHHPQLQQTLKNWDGYGARKINKINSEIDKTLNTTVTKFFAGLNFSGIGKTRIEAIVETMEAEGEEISIQNFVAYCMADKIDAIIGDGLGPALSRAIGANIKLINDLEEYVNIEKPNNGPSTDKLKDLSFCFTGKLDSFSRSGAEKLVKSNGGTVSGVSKKLNYLVMSDPDSTSSKAKRARKLGINIISEEDFLKMIEVEAPKNDTVLFGLDDFEEPKPTESKKDDNILFSIDDL